MSGLRSIHTTDISTLKELTKRTIGFGSILFCILYIIIGLISFYLGPTRYVNFILEFSARNISLVIWLLFGLLYLRQYYPWQFFLLLIPLFGLSDLLWNPFAIISYYPYDNHIIFSMNFLFYVIKLGSIIALILLIVRPHITKPDFYQILIFLLWGIVYLMAGVPIVINIRLGILEPQNIWWEIAWQIIFLITFGEIFTKGKSKIPLKWYFQW